MKQKRKGMLLSHCAVPVGRNLSVGPHTIKHSAQTKTFLTVTFFLEHRNGHSTRLHPPLPTAYISSLFFPHAIALHSLLPHRSSASINERRRNKAKIATTCRVRAGAHITLFTYGQPLMSTFSPWRDSTNKQNKQTTTEKHQTKISAAAATRPAFPPRRPRACPPLARG